MIIVIADDITGAAEIGGIGIRRGLRTGLTTNPQSIAAYGEDYDLLVIATDTRGMNEADACAHTRHIAATLREMPVKHRLFKKTDSALRGHITAELETLLGETGYTRALLLPHNPSKGRIVENGIYKINGIPLSETSFAYDPEFPATTSVVSERLHLKENMLFCDAASSDDVQAAISRLDDDTLAAGAADCFNAFLEAVVADKLDRKTDNTAAFKGLTGETAIIVCGSTQSGDLSTQPYIQRVKANVVPMTREAFYGTSVEQWQKAALADYSRQGSIVLTIGFPSEGGADFALRLRSQMAELCSSLITHKQPHELVIEGGATAFALLDHLKWQSFEIENEIAPGVIRLRYTTPQGTIHITMKPGSYPWGEAMI